MRVVVISDTHIRATSKARLPESVLRALERADLVLHAGDVVDKSLLDELRTFAPLYAVRGNNDIDVDLPDTRVIDVAGVRVGMVHDSGARNGRERRMRKLFPDADVVVFGHSHIPWNAAGIDGQWLFNPGSPTQRRRQPVATYGILECMAGAVARHDVVPVTS